MVIRRSRLKAQPRSLLCFLAWSRNPAAMSYASQSRFSLGLSGCADISVEDIAFRRLTKQAYHADNLLNTVTTPYGKLLEQLVAPTDGGTQTTHIRYVCPFAYLWYACSLSPSLRCVLRKLCCRGGAAAAPFTDQRARIALYLDGVVPGNIQRHDKGRSYVAV